MNNNVAFEDIMDNINNIAKKYGYKNGIDWACHAQKEGIISWSQYKKYENLHELRVRFSHGNAKDILISNESLQKVKEFEKNIMKIDKKTNNERTYTYKPKTVERVKSIGTSEVNLSQVASEIRVELRKLRLFDELSYDDIVLACKKMVWDYDNGDIAAIRSYYNCNLKWTLFNRKKIVEELAENMAASLSQRELDILMNK